MKNRLEWSIISINFEKELAKIGLTPESYEAACADIDAKLDGVVDIDWQEIKEKYHVQCASDTIRKSSSTPFGGRFRDAYFCNKQKTNVTSDKSSDQVLYEKIRKERQKLQTLNLEYNRITRQQSRFELFNEYVAEAIQMLPNPDFKPLRVIDTEKEYVLSIADIHYNAVFKSINNEYSPEICVDKFAKLLSQTVVLVHKLGISKLKVVTLGDDIQGMIRLTDVKLNDSAVVKAVVDISKIISHFLNQLSKYVEIEFYCVGRSNHSQTRPIGTRASELCAEDFEYIIGNYVYECLANNNRVNVILDLESDFIRIPVAGFNMVAMHGHTLKGLDSSIQNMESVLNETVDFLLVGHYHGMLEKSLSEGITCDKEILVCPSFVGSDPYADSIYKGSKSACKLFEFTEYYGHTASFKIQLN